MILVMKVESNRMLVNILV